MSTSRLLALAALAFALPTFAMAQTATPQPQNGAVTGPGVPGNSGTPGNHGHHRFGMRMFLRGITLSDAQQQQIDQLVEQFRQAHQPGTPRNRQAMQNLRTSIENVLTPTQRTQFENNVAQMRKRFKNRQNGGNGQPPPGGGPFAPDASPSPAPPV